MLYLHYAIYLGASYYFCGLLVRWPLLYCTFIYLCYRSQLKTRARTQHITKPILYYAKAVALRHYLASRHTFNNFWFLAFNFYLPEDLFEAWFIIKLIFVGALILYHLQCQIIFQQQSQNVFKFSSTKLRLFNEIATVVLFAVVFLVEIKQSTSWMYAILGVILLVGLITLAVFIYKNKELKKKTQ